MTTNIRRGVYAGSFDPPTNGHLWMIQQGAAVFDELIVAIGINPAKTPMFTPGERQDMLEESIKELGLTNVKVAYFENKFLVNYCAKEKIGYMLRGIRDPKDFSEEHTLRLLNENVSNTCKVPEPQTIYLIPPRKLAEISSSTIKGLIGPQNYQFEEWQKVVKSYVPKTVYKKLVAKFAAPAPQKPGTTGADPLKPAP